MHLLTEANPSRRRSGFPDASSPIGGGCGGPEDVFLSILALDADFLKMLTALPKLLVCLSADEDEFSDFAFAVTSMFSLE